MTKTYAFYFRTYWYPIYRIVFLVGSIPNKNSTNTFWIDCSSINGSYLLPISDWKRCHPISCFSRSKRSQLFTGWCWICIWRQVRLKLLYVPLKIPCKEYHNFYGIKSRQFSYKPVSIAFSVMPIILYISSIIAVLFYIGIIPACLKIIATFITAISGILDLK